MTDAGASRDELAERARRACDQAARTIAAAVLLRGVADELVARLRA